MLPDVNESPLERAKTVLIIEDDELIASIYKRQFESAGFEVSIEMDGSDGYFHIFQKRPDAVLLDLLLPGMDGPIIIGKFRAQPKYKDLPIIVFTNAYLSEAGRDAMKAGATKVFNKATVSPREIVAAVEEALGGAARSFAAPAPSPVPVPAPVKSTSMDLLADPYHDELPAPTAAEPSASAVEPPASAAEAVAGKPEREEAPDASLTAKVSEVPAPADEASPQKMNRERTLRKSAAEDFAEKSDKRLAALRQIVNSFPIEAGQTVNAQAFLNMSRIAHVVSGNAAMVGLHYLAHLAAAVEALAWELFDKPSQFGLPTQKTMAKAMDTMSRLVECGASSQLKEFSRFNVLVVDDHRIARATINKALDRAKLSHVSTGRPELALELLAENEFELVILDVKMDGMSGYELCAELRKIPHQKNCRVLFVSGLKDFQSRASSIQAGGNDFIVKPFAPMELALKALLHMIDSQLDRYFVSQAENGKAAGK